MKDIRPALKEIKKILESGQKPEKVIHKVEKLKEDFELKGTVYKELSNIGYIFNGVAYGPGGWILSGSEEMFEQDREYLLKTVESYLELDWPDSRNIVTAGYQSPAGGFGVTISVQVSGVKVQCPKKDLKKEIEQSLLKLNQNQSAEDFLLNAVCILPTEYNEYGLTI